MNKSKKGILGIALIILAFAGIFLWENVGRQQLLYDDVIVVKKNIDRGTVITEDLLAIRKIEKTNLIKGVVKDYEKILGKESNTYIPAGTQLVMQYFDKGELIPKDGQFTVSIPDDWLKSYPQTLRRGDEAVFYAIHEKSKKPILKATVAYVKNDANQEVSSTDDDRLNGTSNVSAIEVIVDKDQMDILSTYATNGYTFLIMYS